jgi:hypothetical protein
MSTPGAAGVVSSAFSSGQWTGAIAPSGTPAGPEQSLVVPRSDYGYMPGPSLSGFGAGLMLDTILADVVGDAHQSRGGIEGGTHEAWPLPGAADAPDGFGPSGTRSDATPTASTACTPGITHLEVGPIGRRLRAVPVADWVRDELAAATVGWARPADGGSERSFPPVPGGSQRTGPSVTISGPDRPAETGVARAGLAVALLVAGFWDERGRTRRDTIPTRRRLP